MKLRITVSIFAFLQLVRRHSCDDVELNEVASLSPEECSSKGLTSTLLCSSCNSLNKFKLQSLLDDCLRCCSTDELDTAVVKKYPLAELEVCTCKFGRYPQIQAFCTSERAKNWQGLRLRYSRGTEPIIKLMNEDGDVEETFNIDKWDTDTIAEFLDERLEKFGV